MGNELGCVKKGYGNLWAGQWFFWRRAKKLTDAF
jgi:hypothetical protein